MVRRLRHLARNLVKPLMIGLLAVILLLLIPAAFGPSDSVSHVLFVVVIYAAIILLLTAIFVGWAQLEALRADRDQLRAEVQQLRREVARNAGVCQARQVDVDLADRFTKIVTHIQRSA